MPLKKMPRKLIGEILIEEGFVNAQDMKKALQIQKEEGGLIGEILIKRGWVGEENLVIALSKQLSLPYIGLRQYHPNPNAVKLIPKEVAEQYVLFPFEEDGKTLSLSMLDPVHEGAVEAIKKSCSLRIQVFLSTASEIKNAIETYYHETNQVSVSSGS